MPDVYGRLYRSNVFTEVYGRLYLPGVGCIAVGPLPSGHQAVPYTVPGLDWAVKPYPASIFAWLFLPMDMHV